MVFHPTPLFLVLILTYARYLQQNSKDNHILEANRNLKILQTERNIFFKITNG